MRRDELEMYLDHELPAPRQAAVEQTLAGDAQTRRQLEALQAERALRAQALADYEATPTQAAAFTAATLTMLRDEAMRPLARIGPVWVRRAAGLAAALVLVASGYGVGRMQQTSQARPGTVATAAPVATRYVALVSSASGVITQKEFGTLEEAQAFAADQQQTSSQGQLAAADIYSHGMF